MSNPAEHNASSSVYDRQELIEINGQRWNQSKLTNAKVAVVGIGNIARHLGLSIGPEGFGDIEFYGKGKINRNVDEYSDRIFSLYGSPTDSKSEGLAKFLKKINPLIDVSGYDMDLSREKNLSVLGNYDIIFETTNDYHSKYEIIEFAKKKDIPVVSMSASEDRAKMGVFDPKKDKRNENLVKNLYFIEFYGKEQDPIASSCISGLGAEEGRKILMPLGSESAVDDIMIYNRSSNNRFDNNTDAIIPKKYDFKNKSVLMVGVGALGNFAGYNTVLQDIGSLIIVDGDDIEETNLNRQPWFWEKIGEYKSTAFIERMKMINPNVNYVDKHEFLDLKCDKLFEKYDIDLILTTVDKNEIRALVNYYARKYNIPLIDGGTHFDGADVNVCNEICLDCQTEIDIVSLNKNRRENHSCIFAHQPSVVTSNIIAGAWIAAEEGTVFDGKNFGNPLKKQLKYDSSDRYRFNLMPTAFSGDFCNCYKSFDAEGWKKKMKDLYR